MTGVLMDFFVEQVVLPVFVLLVVYEVLRAVYSDWRRFGRNGNGQ